MDEIIEIKNVTKIYNLTKKQQKINKKIESKKVAVDNLSTNIYNGEIYGLLGPNGAGKTTTLRMLATLIKPTKGDIYVNKKSIVKSPDEIRKQIGFLTSELKLDDFFTPNYLYNYFSDLYGINIETREKRKEYLFEHFGLNDFREVKVSDLSTGMKQKVSLVVSIVNDPDILIFDEPTNGLDIVTSKIVTDFLLEQKKKGKTIILSTHIFELVEKICDRVGFIVNGKLIDVIDLKEQDNVNLEKMFFEQYEGNDVKEKVELC